MGIARSYIDFAQDKDIKTRDDQGRLLGKLGDGSFGVVCRGKFIIMSTNNQLDMKKNRFFFNENGLKSKIDQRPHV